MNRTQKAPSGSATFGLVDAPTTGVAFDSSNNPQIVVGGAVKQTWDSNTKRRYSRSYALSGFTASTGVKYSIANPFGADAYITRLLLVVGTPEGGTSTTDIGIAADAVTSNDTILDGVNTNATAGTLYDSLNATDKGTNGHGKARLHDAAKYLNLAIATGTGTTFVGTLYVTWEQA